jgi:threonine/homoserine/homoserine lactone efflux protein
MTEYLILGVTYAFAAAVQPGPFQTYLISQTLTIGWRRTALAAFAPLISDGPIILLVLFLLSRFPGWLVHVLQIAGGVFLLSLAFGAYKHWRDFDAEKAIHSQSDHQTLIKAITVNLLNPAPYISWSLIMGPLLLKGWRESPAFGFALLSGFYTTMIFVTLGVMLLFSFARNLGPRVIRTLLGLSVFALVCFGLYQLWLGSRAPW